MTYPYQGQLYPYDPRCSARVQYPHPAYQQPAYQVSPYQHQQSVPFPGSQPRQPHYAPSYATPPRYPTSRPDRGRDYLASLTTSINNLDLQAGPSSRPVTDKPLPRLPPPPLPERPTSLPSYSSRIPPLPVPPATPHSPASGAAGPSTPPRKSFTPSFHPHGSASQDELLRPPEMQRPHSDSQLPSSRVVSAGKGKGKERASVVDLTADSDDEGTTRQTTPRHRRAQSELPRTPASKLKTPSKASPSPSASTAVRCSGYTRAGQPCKRLVKSTAPYLLRDGETEEERYCKDHAGMICQVGGFYWRGIAGGTGVWVDFDSTCHPTQYTHLKHPVREMLTLQHTSRRLSVNRPKLSSAQPWRADSRTR